MNGCIIKFEKEVFYRNCNYSSGVIKVVGLNFDGAVLEIEGKEFQCKHHILSNECFAIDVCCDGYKRLTKKQQNDARKLNEVIQDYVKDQYDKLEDLKSKVLELVKEKHEENVNRFTSIINSGNLISNTRELERLCSTLFILNGGVNFKSLFEIKSICEDIDIKATRRDSSGMLTVILYVSGKEVVSFSGK